MKHILRWLTGIFFIASAILKLINMDVFENYIYSLGIVDFDISITFARFIISFEAIAGIFLLMRLFVRDTIHTALIVTSTFMLIIAWKLMRGTAIDCDCVGDLISLSPLQSLLTGALLILALVYIRQTKPVSFKYGSALAISIIVIFTVVPQIISPPDYYNRKAYRLAVNYDQLALNHIFRKGMLPDELNSGKHLICFYSVNCRFCNMAAQRIDIAAEKIGLRPDDVYNVFWESSPENISEFYHRNHSREWNYSELDDEMFLDVTEGSFPLILLFQNGQVIDKIDYRSFDETRLRAFMQ